MSMSRNKCCVPGCIESGNVHKTLHKFPNPEKSKERLNVWVHSIGGDIIGLEDHDIYKHRSVCHIHFEEKFCCRYNKLSNIAVPTLNLPGPLSLPRFSLINERRPMRQLQHFPASVPSTSASCADLLFMDSPSTFACNDEVPSDITMKENIDESAEQTQPEAPVPEDPLMVEHEYAMDIVAGEDTDDAQSVASPHPPGGAANDRDEDYRPSEDVEYDDSEYDGSPSLSVHTEPPTDKLATNLLPAKATTNPPNKLMNLPTGPAAKCTANLPTEKIGVDDNTVSVEPKQLDEVPSGAPRMYGAETPRPRRMRGKCRCCLKVGIHDSVDIRRELDCFNLEPSADPRVSRLLCAECGAFLRQARRFRDTARCAEITLLTAARALQPPGDDNKPLVKMEYVPDSDIFKVPGAGPSAAKRKRLVFVNQMLTFKPGHSTVVHLDELHKETLVPPAERQESDDIALEVSIPTEDTPDVADSLETPDVEDRMESADAAPGSAASEGAGARERSFSAFSDYSDFEKDFKEIDISIENIDKMVTSMTKERARNFCLIRDNLVEILECSTVLPFHLVRDQLECIYCDYSHLDIHHLRTHVDTEHRDESRDQRNKTLKRLPQAILRADVSLIQCRLCSEQFTTIDNLVQHLINVHERKFHNIISDPPHNILIFDMTLDQWKCLACQTVFTSYMKLVRHMNKHFGSFLCHLCGCKFLYPTAYSKHMQVHHTPKEKDELNCEECNQSFKTKKDLMDHKNSNHYDDTRTIAGSKRKYKEELLPEDETDNTVYECILCSNGTFFTGKNAAYMHRIGHLNNTREGPFSCEMCEYSSDKKVVLKQHLKKHYGIRNFVCEICDKRYDKKIRLLEHLHTHLNVRYQCPLCDTTLSNKKHVKQHVKNKHPDVTVQISY